MIQRQNNKFIPKHENQEKLILKSLERITCQASKHDLLLFLMIYLTCLYRSTGLVLRTSVSGRIQSKCHP